MKLAEVDDMNILYADGKIIATIPDSNDYDPPAWQPTNCRCCGAGLTSGQSICDYCPKSRPLKEDLERQ